MDANKCILNYFSIDKIINYLNTQKKDKDENAQLTYGSFIEEKNVVKNFAYGTKELMRAKQLVRVDLHGTYQLIEPYEFAIVHPFNPSGIRGTIMIEKGIHLDGSSDGESYETMRMILKEPLELVNGVIIPKSSIKIYVEEGSVQERRDHLKRWVGWKHTNLEELLPTSIFLK
ncbi:MAG: hypothetical protein WC916_01695 [Candidatus Woesearchaeota archaeon]